MSVAAKVPRLVLMELNLSKPPMELEQAGLELEEVRISGEVLLLVTLFCYEITTKPEERDWPRVASSWASVLLKKAGWGLPGLYNGAGGGRSESVAWHNHPCAADG